ncbi:MAG: leucine-rich repeat protein [Clostridia bacterium]|nr:leucine-rich repeat protein [Clostridia bacterium]
MAILKCKMCGGALTAIDNKTVIECEYCGATQTLPKTDNEDFRYLFDRANDLRRSNEFDKAEEMYEEIISITDSEAEAYWGAILSKYGIEYVEDPATGKRIPTCHRASFEAIVADDYYKKALERADALQRAVYEEEAKRIDEIQKEILAISSQEDPYDVFICYKETDEFGKRTQDSVIANDIYHQLTQEGYKVFYAAITLEDKLGSAYEPIIFAALTSSKVMLAIGTKPEYFNAVWVKNEWSRFLKMMKKDRSKMLIPCYRDMDAYALPEQFAHLQAQDMGKIGFISDIVRGIGKVVKKDTATTTPNTYEKPKTISFQSESTEKAVKELINGNYKQAQDELDVLINSDTCNDPLVYIYYLMAQHNMYSEDFTVLKNIPNLTNNFYYKIAVKNAHGDLLARLNALTNTITCFSKYGEVLPKYLQDSETVVIPDGIKVIPENAFENCHGIKTVVLPSSVKKIDNQAFKGCSRLESISFEHIEELGSFCFNDTNISEVVLSNKIKHIGSFVFGDKLKRIELPAKDISFDKDYRINSGGVDYVKVPFEYANRISVKKSATVEICEGVETLDDEHKLPEYFTTLILPSTLKSIQISLSNTYVNFSRLIIKAEDLTISTEYFLLSQKILEFKASNQILVKVYCTYPYHTDETKNAIITELSKTEEGKQLASKLNRKQISLDTGDVLNTATNIASTAGALKGLASVGGCYVATCVYGSYDCPEVWTLRRYRDDTLGSTWYGRLFIRTYYAISPTLVKWFGHTRWFKRMWRGKLDRMVKRLQDSGVESTPYQDKSW